MPLNDKQIRALGDTLVPRKIADSAGLHLLLTPAGGKLWRLSYRYDKKQKLLALGAYPAVSLAEARAKRDNAKKLMANGIDPSQQAKLDKIERSSARANTFAAVAAEFLEKVAKDGRAEATLIKKRWLVGLSLPDLGNRPIAQISAVEILVGLRKVEAAGNHETARRLRATISQVFRFAIATARAQNDPTAGLKGALITPQATHRAAVTDRGAFEQLIRAIWGYEGSLETCAALKLMALLYPRPGELRRAEWAEFDLDKGVWTIPAARTKMRREHRKPLAPLAVAILEALRNHTGNRRLAFPSMITVERPISENTLNGALRRLGYKKEEATSHGFRASASSLLNESGRWNPDAIEAELGHMGADEVRRAYHRARYWDERMKMATWWASAIERWSDS